MTFVDSTVITENAAVAPHQ